MKTPRKVKIVLISLLMLLKKTIEQGAIYLFYKYETQTLIQEAYTMQDPNLLDEKYADVSINEDFAYGLSEIKKTIEKINLEDYSLVNKIDLPYFALSKGLIVSPEDQVITAQIILEENEDMSITNCLLNFFDANLNLTDSILVESGVTDVHALKVVDNKFFLSVTKHTVHSIFVFDLITKNELAEIKLNSGFCTQFIMKEHDELMAMTGSEILFLNTASLNIDKSIALFSHNNFGSTASHYTFNQSDNILYYLSLNAQPAPIPYILAAINLETEEISYLNVELDTDKAVHPPIVYDHEREVILGSDNNIVKILSEEGAKINEIHVPGEIVKIIVN